MTATDPTSTAQLRVGAEPADGTEPGGPVLLTEQQRDEHELLDGVTVAALPPRVIGIWGSETVYCDGVRYGRCHGGPWFEESRTCGYYWGDFACEKRAHGRDEKHSLVWANAEDDIDPRLT